MLKPHERRALINQALRRLGQRRDALARQARRRLLRELAATMPKTATPRG